MRDLNTFARARRRRAKVTCLVTSLWLVVLSMSTASAFLFHDPPRGAWSCSFVPQQQLTMIYSSSQGYDEDTFGRSIYENHNENVGFSQTSPSDSSSSISRQSNNSSGKEMRQRANERMSAEKDPYPQESPILPLVTIQGGSLRTWSFPDPAVERIEVLLKTDGRPLNVNIDLWQGPENTPERIGIYIEDGRMRPFCAILQTPRGPNTLAIRNTAQLEFPVAAHVEARETISLLAVTNSLEQNASPTIIQGGAIRSFSFAFQVESVQLLLKTNGRPLNARVELLQGPNNNKQVMELYTEDGLERPFFTILETPGAGNVVRVINSAPVEFPLSARVEPYMVEPGYEGPLVTTDDGPLSYGNLLDR